jgi:hypothetical protein
VGSNFKRFRRGNLTANPRAFFRDPNLSRFGAGYNKGFMAPNAGGALASLGNMLTRTSKEATPAFSGGIIGRMGAITKLERRAARNASSKAVLRGDLNLARIAKMNGGPLSTQVYAPPGSRLPAVRNPATGRFMQNPGNFSTQATTLGGVVNKTVAGEALSVGERRYMTTMGVNATKSQNFMRALLTPGGGVEMRTAMGTAGTKAFGITNIAMTDAAEKMIRPLAGALGKDARLLNTALNRGIGTGAGFASSLGDDVVKARMGTIATEIVDKGIIKSLGTKGALSAVKHGGARVGLAVAGEAALAAVPGLNLIFAADMAYQLAKLGGLAVKAGINFGKDGMKSMQGNMHTGVFGAGYKDDEVRATSRARGVSAIQNSRLNARSLLGSEGAMMASHFG